MKWLAERNRTALDLAELILTLSNFWLLVLFSLTRPRWTTHLLPTTVSRRQPLPWSTLSGCIQIHPQSIWVLMVFAPAVLIWMEKTEFCVSFLLICLAFVKVSLPCGITPSWLTGCWLCLSPSPWWALVGVWKWLMWAVGFQAVLTVTMAQ